MRRLISVIVGVLAMVAFAAPTVLASGPRFVGTCTVTRGGNNPIVSCKQAGLGDEQQIVYTVSADVACINLGGNNPNAANKSSFASTVNVPVRNGMPNYSVTLVANFQPSCSPPMTAQWSILVVFDQTNDLTQSFAGPS
jgi:hypothetical protein